MSLGRRVVVGVVTFGGTFGPMACAGGTASPGLAWLSVGSALMLGLGAALLCDVLATPRAGGGDDARAPGCGG